MGKKSKETGLNERQELFCQYYVTEEFFANGTRAYIQAYGIDESKSGSYAAARASAYDLLTNPNILNRINELLDLSGLNDQFVDKQLLWVISQQAELAPKVAAIKEYNALKQRITQKLDLTTKGKEINITNFTNLTDEELQKALRDKTRD